MHDYTQECSEDYIKDNRETLDKTIDKNIDKTIPKTKDNTIENTKKIKQNVLLFINFINLYLF